jgi:hypothetical protein
MRSELALTDRDIRLVLRKHVRKADAEDRRDPKDRSRLMRPVAIHN